MSDDRGRLDSSEAHYLALFDATSNALVEEDFSQVKLFLEEIRARGVGDLDAYFRENPAELRRCIDLIRILRFNSGFAETLNLPRDESVGPRISPYIPDGDLGIFRDELTALYQGKRIFDAAFENRIPGAQAQYLRLRLAIVQDHEEDWSSVLVSFTDLSAETRARDELAELVQQKDVLMRELEHRVKNNLNIISSLLSLESAQIGDAAAKKALLDAQSRIKSISLIYELLSRSTLGSTLNCKAYIEALAGLIKESYAADRGDVVLHLDVEDLEIDVKRGVSLGLTATELLTNAFKYAFPGRGGEVRVELAARDGSIGLSIADDGIGASADIDFGATSSLGFQLIDMLVRQMRGTIKVTPSPGFRADVSIPRAP